MATKSSVPPVIIRPPVIGVPLSLWTKLIIIQIKPSRLSTYHANSSKGSKAEGAIDPEELTRRLEAHLGEMSLRENRKRAGSDPQTETPRIQTQQFQGLTVPHAQKSTRQVKTDGNAYSFERLSPLPFLHTERSRHTSTTASLSSEAGVLGGKTLPNLARQGMSSEYRHRFKRVRGLNITPRSKRQICSGEEMYKMPRPTHSYWRVKPSNNQPWANRRTNEIGTYYIDDESSTDQLKYAPRSKSFPQTIRSKKGLLSPIFSRSDRSMANSASQPRNKGSRDERSHDDGLLDETHQKRSNFLGRFKR
jgi:hypothetical protein